MIPAFRVVVLDRGSELLSTISENISRHIPLTESFNFFTVTSNVLTRGPDGLSQ
jgi:hypothetical protein